MVMKVIRGNVATAHAVRLAGVQVIPIFPITPSTMFPEKISEFIANGEMQCEFIPCESEHSAMSACIGASASGARVATATSSQGLALMHELLFVASGMRLPIVTVVGNRSLSAPINIWCDHQDSIAQRDTGWLQFYCETNQESFDLMLAGFRVSEDPRVLLPSMVCLDAFILTHTMEKVDIPESERVAAYLPPYRGEHAYLDPERPITQGSFVSPAHYMEFKEDQHDAMLRANDVVREAFTSFHETFGREYAPISGYRVDGAELLILTMGSITGTARVAVDRMRARGENVGLLKLTMYRPFPVKDLLRLTRGADILAVVERNISLGASGAVFADVCASLANTGRDVRIYDFIVGMGGRDVLPDDIETIAALSREAAERQRTRMVEWVSSRGGRGHG